MSIYVDSLPFCKWFAVLRWCLPLGLEKLGLNPTTVSEVEFEIIPEFPAYCWMIVGEEAVMIHEFEAEQAKHMQ